MTLRKKLLLGLVAFTVIPLAGAVLLVHSSLTRHLEQNAGHDLHSRVARTAEELTGFVTQRHSDLRTFGSDPVFASGQPERIAGRLKQLSLLSFYFDDLYFVDPHGRVAAATASAARGRRIVDVFPQITEEVEQVQRIAARAVVISDLADVPAEVLARAPNRAVRPGDMRLEFLTPVLDESGRPLGILIGELSQTGIGAKIAELADRTAGSEAAYLLARDGRVLATPGAKVGLLQPHPNWAELTQALDEGAHGFTIYRNFEGRKVLSAVARTSPLGAHNPSEWTVVAVMPYDQIMAPALRIIRTLTWLLVSVLFVATVAGLLLARSVVRPLEAVTEAARQLAAGRLEARAPVLGRDETAVLATTFNDMATTRQRVEAELRETESRFRQLAENSSEVFWFLKVNPVRLIYISPTVEKLWGVPAQRFYDEPMAWLQDIHPEDRSAVEKRFAAELAGETPRYEMEYRIVRPDGSFRWVLVSGTWMTDESGQRVRMGGIMKDVTERRQAEAQRLRTQRLESIGTLAGGLAHDLNNALAPILMGLELIRKEVPKSADIINTMEASARRGAEMVRRLLTFAKGMDGTRRLLQPQGLLVEMEKLIRATFPKNIQLRTIYAPDLHTISGDATQLHQILLNLCVNARDAMPDGGVLTLESSNVEVDDAFASIGDAKPGPHVQWRVTDTGTGIPPDIIDRIFDPFFTTKDPDKGTGLGLATIVGIVKSHGGFVRVYSVVGQGTTFAVYFPATGEAAAETPLAVDETFRANGETVLIVDDEAPVRDIARRVLTALNFQVITAADGTEALIQVAEKRAEIRAVITDLHMPHMDGVTFVRVLKQMLPDAGIIVASGRLDERAAKQFGTLGVTVQLEKPFTQQKLVEALRAVWQT